MIKVQKLNASKNINDFYFITDLDGLEDFPSYKQHDIVVSPFD